MRAAALLGRVTYLRYIGASAAALAVDLSVFLALQAGGMLPGLAEIAGYATGVVAHWLLSSRAVFAGDRAFGHALRQRQLLFILSALAGLALTYGIVSAGAAMGLDPRLAKLVAVGVSFQVTYLLRARVVFA